MLGSTWQVLVGSPQSLVDCFFRGFFFSGFIAFSSMPQLAEKIKMFFVLGPAYALHTGKGPVLSLFYLPDAIIKVSGVCWFSHPN